MKRGNERNIKTYRDYLEEAADKGDKSAIYAIKELELPMTDLSPYIKVLNVNVRRKVWKKKVIIKEYGLQEEER
jgi:hypothetical protein